MSKIMRTLRGRRAGALRRALDKVETSFLAAQGRRVVRRKVRAIAAISRKATKAGLIAGGLAAAGVVRREIRKARS